MQQLSLNSTLTLTSGNKIPMLGFGTYQLRGPECLAGTLHALQLGYTHIDTASIYRNESEIKQAIQQSQLSRDKLYITSKISPQEQGYNQARKAVNGILERLGCGYLDLVLVHWPGVGGLAVGDQKNAEVRVESWRALAELQKEGKVRDIGVSNFLKHHLEHLFKHSEVRPAVNQIELHPLLWEAATITFCQEHNIAIEAYSPLARQDPALFQNPALQALSAKYSKSIAQISLRWALQHGFIVLPKSKSPARIEQNMRLWDFALNAEDMGVIDGLRQAKVRTCWDPNSIVY